MKSVLITGATSFLGLQIISQIQSQNIEPHIIVRPSSDLSRIPNLEGVQCHTYDGSVNSLVTALQVAKADVCINLAGAYVREHSSSDIDSLIDSNFRFGGHLLEAMKESRTDYLVNAGSTFQYFHSDHSAPLNLYAAIKQSFFNLISYYAESSDLAYVNIILPDVYGPSDWRLKIMKRLVEANLKETPLELVDRKTILGLVHVADAAEAFIYSARQLMKKKNTFAGKCFGVDIGHRFRLDEIVQAVERCCEQHSIVNWGTYATPERHVKVPWEGPTVPGWKPKITLENGINQLVEEVRRGQL